MALGRIKARESTKDIKVLDKAAVASERMKTALVRSKDQAENLMDDGQISPSEYAEDKIRYAAEDVTDQVWHEVSGQTKKAIEKGKEAHREHRNEKRIHKNEERVRRYEEELRRGAPSRTPREETAQQAARQNTEATRTSIRSRRNQTIKSAERTERTIKQSARSAGKQTVKAGAKGTVKSTERAVKTAEKTSKAAIKTAEATAKATQKAAAAAAKAAVKATIAAVKAIIAATKALVAAIAAGGWVAVAVIVVICLIALICGSVFGIFFSGEDSGTGMSMQTAVQEINADYDAKMEAEKNSVAYDNMEISGGRAVWKDVLAVYAVKTNTDKDNPQEVATMDESKKQILSDIFWEMNSISSRSESHSETEITETDDGNGNIVQTETTVTKTTLYITVSHLTVNEMADLYGFDAGQREYLAELLKDENNSLWAAVLYGIRYSEDPIVTVALSQVGNVGGEPYWSWYGFGSRVEWCACFVSWCADQCGYIDTGVVPKYAGCVNGVQWFKDRGQWIDGSAEPVPGMIIFFDWDNKGSSGPQDGQSDHTGIVQKVEDGIVYTVEGNSGDSCRVNQYSVGHYEILGYGVPNY